MRINGLIAAPVTPFKENGDIDPEKIKIYADSLKQDGVSGVFVNGTTGEGFSLTIDERKVLAEAWTLEKSVNFKVIIHTGHTSIRSTIDLAEHAESLGADAVGEMGPIFFKPATENELAKYCRETASVTNLPYYYYHMPSMNGLDFSMTKFLKCADIPNLCGVKYTHHDLEDFNKCQKLENNKYDMLWGRDETLIKALKIGTNGAVGSTYNSFCPLYLNLIEEYKNDKLENAEYLQQQSINLVSCTAGRASNGLA